MLVGKQEGQKEGRTKEDAERTKEEERRRQDGGCKGREATGTKEGRKASGKDEREGNRSLAKSLDGYKTETRVQRGAQQRCEHTVD